MGARPLRRTIQTQVEDKLSELLLGGQVKLVDKPLKSCIEKIN